MSDASSDTILSVQNLGVSFGRGRAAAAHGSFAGPGRARGNLHAHSNPDAR